MITLGSVIEKDQNYYPQLFPKQCRYIQEKVIRLIIDGLQNSSNDSDNSDDSNEEQIKPMLFKKTILKK